MDFIVRIERAQMAVRRYIQLDPASLESRTGGTPLAAIAEAELICGFRSVEPASAARGDPPGHAAEPPVEQIEVMRGLVNEKAAGIRLVPMPAAEIVGTVIGIELPFEIHRGNLTDNAGHKHLLEQGPRR